MKIKILDANKSWVEDSKNFRLWKAMFICHFSNDIFMIGGKGGWGEY